MKRIVRKKLKHSQQRTAAIANGKFPIPFTGKKISYAMLKPGRPETGSTFDIKVSFLNRVFLFAGAASLGLGIYRWQSSMVMGSIDFIFAACNFALFYYLARHKEYVEVIGSVALAISYCLFTAIYLLAPYNSTRFSLFFLLLASAFFLKGRKAGFAWLTLVLLTFVAGHFLPGFDSTYSNLEIVTGSFYFIALFFIILNYENFKEIVNERDREKEVLQLNEALFRAIVESGNDIICIISETGLVRFASPSVESVLGFVPKEIISKNINELIHPDDQPRFASSLSDTPHHPGATALNKYELRIKHKDGSYRNIEMVGRNLTRNPAIGGIVLNGRDITDSKKAEVNLSIAGAAFDAQEGILIADASNVILRVNKAFTTITGYSMDEVVGKNPKMLSSGRHDAAFYAAMWDVLNNTGAWKGDVWNRHKSGEIYLEHLTITAVRRAGIVINYVATLIDITASRMAEERIKHLAFYDPLTRLPNRRLLQDRLQHAMNSSLRSGRGGALLFIDMDNFKTLNETLGHETGDSLLLQVAHRLESCVREGGTVARLGGDEFVVVLENLSTEAAEAAAQTEDIGEKILVSLRQPYLLAATKYRCTTSIGVVLFNDRQLSLDELMKQADIAMYQAKKAGRNTLRFFDMQMQEAINKRAALEEELHKALENHQFHLRYQIQVDKSHRPLGAEALIHWEHPDRGLMSAAQFIPLAEETGQILPIGQWVLETACAQLKSWQESAKTRELVLAVNVSAKQFHQADFVVQVRAAIQRHAIDPRLLKLELTESMLLENIEDTIATMHALKAVGIQFSLDDFGTGYSSLQYLKRLPLDQIKIDQSFVRDLTTNNSDKAIVRTIIAMAQSLNLDVIAEGVETEDQRQILVNKSCIHFQGYLFGRPMPIEEIDAVLEV